MYDFYIFYFGNNLKYIVFINLFLDIKHLSFYIRPILNALKFEIDIFAVDYISYVVVILEQVINLNTQWHNFSSEIGIFMHNRLNIFALPYQ